MMKKLSLVFIFISLVGFMTFGDDSERHEIAIEETGYEFLWWIIPFALTGIALIAANIFLVSWHRRSSCGEIAQEVPKVIPASAPAAVPGIYILTEEEIRRHAFELYQQRNGQNGDEVKDWHRSVRELTSCYGARGYRVILYREGIG